MDAVAALDQHTQRRVEVFAFVTAVEGVGKQHDFAAIGRPDCVGLGAETRRAEMQAGCVSR